MKTNPSQPEKQYARVARVFPKTDLSSTNARIKVLGINKNQK
jgi:hypothetical protein